MTMNTLSNLLLILLISFSIDVCVSEILSDTEIPGTSNLLVTRLSHDNSVDSPTFNPHATLEQLAKVAFDSSVKRVVTMNGGYSLDLETDISPIKGGFHAILEVGSQRTIQRVYLDTGSSLFWINCEPCVLNVPEEIFQPRKSDSYMAEVCENSQWCFGLLGSVQTSCDDVKDKCSYQVNYAGNKSSTGYLGSDAIKFVRSQEVLDGTMFGCSRNTDIFSNGVLGLGMNRISVVAQSKYSKFSYCLGDVIDPQYQSNTLIIGDKITLRGSATPMISQNHYFINLDQIKIGGIQLNVDMQIFKRSPDDYTGGVAVDTGATYTFFPLVVLEKFELEIRKVLSNARLREVADSKLRVCYEGNMLTDLNSFPAVEFIFQDNAVMELGVRNLFHQVDNQRFCLAFMIKPENVPFSVLGNIIQQYFYVAFDLTAMKVAFEKMDCITIEDKIIHDEL